MSSATKHASVTLLWGEDEFLLRERALELLGGLKPTEVDAAEWRGSELQDLATPSLFGEPRALLITDAKRLPKEALAELACLRGRSRSRRTARDLRAGRRIAARCRRRSTRW